MQIGLVGATNAGKSTLFNRLIGQFRAIVTDIPGTTRDILFHTALIDNIGEVVFADSPGLEFNDERVFIKEIVDSSDLILFMIDDKAGITSKEEHIMEYIRKQNKQKQTILIVNKLDLRRKEAETELALSDYHKLGFKHTVGISAKNYRNLDTLQDEILLLIKSGNIKVKKEEEIKKNPSGIALAILGKPNVGKSTLLNTLAKKQLAKVENISGTTRDYIVGDFFYNKKQYTVYDTAGFRKKGKMQVIEKIAYTKTIDMLKYTRPIVLFLIDSIEDISHRDMTLLHEINQIGLCIIVGLNKTDLLSDAETKTLTKKIQAYLDFAKYIPIIPMVATTGEGIKDIMTMVTLANKEMKKRINTNELNTIISNEFFTRPPRFPKNKICKLMYITQTEIDAPTFIVFVNHKDRANFAFKKRIDNSIRKHFGYIATPLVIRFRSEKGTGKDNKSYRESQEKKKAKKEAAEK